MGLVLLDCLVNSVTGTPLSVSCLVVLALQKKPCYGVKCNCRECLRYNLPHSHNRSIAMSSGEFLGMTPAILNRIEFAVKLWEVNTNMSPACDFLFKDGGPNIEVL